MNTGTLEVRTSRTFARRYVKLAARVVARVIVSPLILLYRFFTVLSSKDPAIQGASQCLALLPGTVGVYLRRAFFEVTLSHCATDCSIGFGTTVATSEIVIGGGVYIGAFCTLGHVTIGDDVLIGSNVTLLSGKHQHLYDRLDVPIRHQGGRFTRVDIGRDVWIGNGAIIMADIGEQAVVAAGSVVVRPIPPRSIVAGNPAKTIGVRGSGQNALSLSS